MTSPAVTVDRTATVREAAHVMIEHDTHRVVVTDDAGRPVGVLSAMDFVYLAAE